MISDYELVLKPRGVMELLDQAIRLYRNNFLKFVGIIAVAQVPIQLVQMVINILVYQGTTGSSDFSNTGFQALGSSLVTLLSAILSYIFVSGLATAALTRAITGSYLGEDVTIFGAYEHIKDRWGTLLFALFLVGMLGIPLLIWALVPCIGWVTGFGMVMFLGVVIAPLIAPIIVIEHLDAAPAIRRGWELARRRFWWLTGFFLLLGLFNLLVVQGPVYVVTAALAGVIAQGADSANLVSSGALQTITSSLLALILSLLYVPLEATCATLAYFDLRVRQEGLDLTLMTRPDGGDPASALDLIRQVPQAVQSSIITWQEMGYFALVSLILAGFYGIFYAILMVFFFAMYSIGG